MSKITEILTDLRCPNHVPTDKEHELINEAEQAIMEYIAEVSNQMYQTRVKGLLAEVIGEDKEAYVNLVTIDGEDFVVDSESYNLAKREIRKRAGLK